MRTIFFLLICMLCLSCNHETKQVTPPVPVAFKDVKELKVVFIVANKDIDFNKMAIDDIVAQIKKDSVLSIERLSPDVYLKPQIIKVYKIEDITCPYLKDRFKKNDPGELVYEYNGKVLIKLKDGVIKVYHSHLGKEL